MSDITNCSSVLDEVFAERTRQEELKAAGKFLWSCADNSFHSNEDFLLVTDAEKMCVLSEEVGEAARELTDSIIAVSKGMPNVSEQHLRKMRTELIQVAAVAVAWVESLNKRGLGPSLGSEHLPSQVASCDHKFIGSMNCLKCGVSAVALNAEMAKP